MYKCILIYYNVDDDVYVADGVDVVVDDDDGDDGDDDDGDDEGDDDYDGADDDSNEDDDGDDDDDYDGDDDGGDDDDDEEEEDGERKMMMWMLRRKRKMMMMMLRRKTDPKTGKHTLCEPPQSKCTRTFHMSHFVEIYRTSAVRQARNTRFVRACAVEMHMGRGCATIY